MDENIGQQQGAELVKVTVQWRVPEEPCADCHSWALQPVDGFSTKRSAQATVTTNTQVGLVFENYTFPAPRIEIKNANLHEVST
jgi:hypothetical protein